jgi:hypothetical protein
MAAIFVPKACPILTESSRPTREKGAERIEKSLDRAICIQYTNSFTILRK